MAIILKLDGEDMADIAKVDGYDVPAGGALAEDVEGDTIEATTTPTDGTYKRRQQAIAATTELTIVTQNLNFDASSLAFAAGFMNLRSEADAHVLRLYMGGVLMQTSAAFVGGQSLTRVVRDFKVLAGSQDCILKVYNTAGVVREIWSFGYTATSVRPAAIAVGSVKLV